LSKEGLCRREGLPGAELGVGELVVAARWLPGAAIGVRVALLAVSRPVLAAIGTVIPQAVFRCFASGRSRMPVTKSTRRFRFNTMKVR